MKRQDAIDVLRRHAEALQARGIRHAALFGSVARGDAGPESDLDILIELDPNLRIDLFHYVGLARFVEELFSTRVDVVDREALKPHLRDAIAADAIYAF